MHGSRRAASLQPSDYDHEITITDDEEAPSLQATNSEGGGLFLTNTSTRLLSDRGAETEEEQGQSSEQGERAQGDPSHLQPIASKGKDGRASIYKSNTLETAKSLEPPRSSTRPSIEIHRKLHTLRFATEQANVLKTAPSGEIISPRTSNWDNRSRPRSREQRETAIDILYENERGGFFCGVGLFASAALGGLDPTPWSE